jgi:hypothetical protein
MVLLLYDLHLLPVHTATMNRKFRKCTVHFFYIFSAQYKVGSLDVLSKVLDLACSGDGNDERLLGKQPCERYLCRRAAFFFASSAMRSRNGLFAAMVDGWKRSNPERRCGTLGSIGLALNRKTLSQGRRTPRPLDLRRGSWQRTETKRLHIEGGVT